ncbi:MAG: S9 family peptidase [Gemmatimonadetes bacterium]|nr:S9 family peptidase [Gemmatimonadota bacterium]
MKPCSSAACANCSAPRDAARAFTGAVIAVGLSAVAACARSPYPPPPETRQATVVDTLHGVTFRDPYRWLEDQQSPEVRQWIAAQNAYADSIIGDTPSRRQIASRLRELMGAPNIGQPRKAGSWEYFTLRRSGEEVGAIYRRRAPARPTPIDPEAEYQKIVDPLAIRSDATTGVGIEGFSPDGRLMLYSVRDGGPDEISVRVRDVANGADLPDSLPWALYASISFDRTGAGFYYVHRSRQIGPRLKYHQLGTDPARDSVLFGDGLEPTSFLNASFPQDGRWRLYHVGHGWARNDVWLQNVSRGGGMITIAKDLPAHFAPQFIDGKVWMRTDLDAPKGRIVVVDPSKPAPETWTEVVPEGEDVLDGFSQIDGKLYVTYLHDVSHRIRVFTMDGKPAGEVPLPDHAAATIRGNGKGRALLTTTSLAQPLVTYQVNLATGERTVWESAEVPFDSAGIGVRQVWYTSKDGTRAPMYLMHRRGLAPNGDTPTLLHGYGGFTVSLMPRFDPRAAWWVERGGLYAQATLRGGNEFGEAWHRDGMLGNKQHVFDDFLAAAQWLVDSGYTRPQRFAIRGTSNGGLLMGAAITQQPDRFRAAYIGYPDLDMVRFYQFRTANNLPALLEYGDASNPEQFEAIRKFSPYQHLRDGTSYPAVMFRTGYWDTRVPPWQARKMAARLQAATRSRLPVILYHDPRSGHAGGRPWSLELEMAAREMEFLLRMVGAADSASAR